MENQDLEVLDSPQYEKGFNNGYLISKYEPELSDKLLVSLNQLVPQGEDMYVEGLKNGMLEREYELHKEANKQYSKGGPSSPDKSRDIDRDPTR